MVDGSNFQGNGVWSGIKTTNKPLGLVSPEIRPKEIIG
jgi:hypothetical protein